MQTNSKIMLVDDELDFLEIIGKFLTRRKIDFVTACGCLEALDLLNHHRFDVVIMDVSMPGLGGIECMAELKKLKPEPEIIILTGHGSLNTGLTGMKRGAFDYCLKPVDFEELLEKILLAREKAANQQIKR
jgi:DNA-binding NtrC family response regulator